MDFIEDIVFEDNVYRVSGERITVDNSFAHEFGIEVGYYFAVDNLTVISAYNDYGESLTLLVDSLLIYELTQILEEKFNES